MRRVLFFLAVSLCACAVSAQDQSKVAAAFEHEGEAIRENCFKSFGLGCGTTLFTGEPVHVSAGTIAPQNGVGIGAAVLWHVTPSEQWRATGSVDGVRAFGGAWRAGAYANFVRTALDDEHSHVCERLIPGRDVFPVIGVYTQSTSLPQVTYFGIGPDTALSDKTFFGLQETIVGARGVCLLPGTGPLGALRLSVTGEANGRFVGIRSGPGGSVPSIEQRFTDVTAPGLASQSGIVQFGEGIRATPSIAGVVNLNYLLQYQQFSGASGSATSFERWTLDLRHEILMFGTTVPAPRDTNDPNSCALGPTTRACPSVASRNRTGSLTLRAYLSRSVVSGANAVPFYFQRTIGGSDLDGNRLLASYEDYRFRAPHLLLFQETFEHGLGRVPLGIWLSADHGVVARQNDPFDMGKLRNTFTAGLSFRAGGLPMALLTFAAGGPEGHHVALTISPSLTGGSSRPSLQ